MSTAHRPTFVTAQGKNDSRAVSLVYSSRDMAAQTKLKFRKAGQTSTSDLRTRDLRADLLLAEASAAARKRKAAGLPSIDVVEEASEDVKRRRMILAAAVEEDKDQSSSEEENGSKLPKDGQEDEDVESDSEEEDDTAELMRELAKIKKERAEDQARKDAANDSIANANRDDEIARGNPLLQNLASALGGQTPSVASSHSANAVSASAGFTVKRRWDDDLVFKNQANQAKDKHGKEFVNDLLRSDFHRSFLKRFIA